ncbi:MAG: hypothetical protein WCE43_04805, partial [Burkholderiales bacterium]
PAHRALFTPWVRLDDEMQIRVQRSKAMGVVVSVLLHILFLFLLFQTQKHGPTTTNQSSNRPFDVVMIPEPAASPAQSAPVPKPLRKPTPPKRTFAVITAPTFAPPLPQAPPEPTPLPQPPPIAESPPAPVLDMLAALNAKRAARQAQENPDGQNSRAPTAGEIATANINRNLATLTTKRDGTSGVFQVLSKGTRIGQFSFNGWKTDRNNSWREVIEVDAGLMGDVELAIVRRMIELIRSHYKGDFTWDSHKLGRAITLSARMEDNEGLEAFMMREFFDGRR